MLQIYILDANIERAEKKKKYFKRRNLWSHSEVIHGGFMKLAHFAIQVNQVKGKLIMFTSFYGYILNQ